MDKQGIFNFNKVVLFAYKNYAKHLLYRIISIIPKKDCAISKNHWKIEQSFLKLAIWPFVSIFNIYSINTSHYLSFLANCLVRS